MNSKEMAMRQIDDIYAVVHNNLKAALSGPLMIATGLMVMAIPAIELLFKQLVDPFVMSMTGSSIILFGLKTLFYWTLFTSISSLFKRQKPNPFIAKLFAVVKFFPFIPLAVGAALGVAGYTELVAPIVLVLIGVLFLIFGQFSARAVSLLASNLIIAGIVGIWLTTFAISHLWAYLLVYAGLSYVVLGLVLQQMQRNTFTE